MSIPVKDLRRSYLRSIHARLPAMIQEMNVLYDREYRAQHWDNLLALLYILIELCPDSILCDRFVDESEFHRFACRSTESSRTMRPSGTAN